MTAIPRSPSALEALARLRTMRGLLAGEDRDRFERLVADVEQAVWEIEGVTADLARLLAAEGLIAPVAVASAPVQFTDVLAGALRGLDALFASRSVLVDIDTPPAVLVFGDRGRLEHLMATALTIAAAVTPNRGHVQLRYQLDGTLAVRLSPYRSRDPRGTIVEALARSQGIQVEASEDALALWLPVAPRGSLATLV